MTRITSAQSHRLGVSSTIRVADFFCGCGGTSAGLRAAGMQIALGVDFEPDAASTFRRNFPEAAFLQQDIREVSMDVVQDLLGQPSGHLLFSACAPCQPYSSFVGSKRPDPRRTLLLRLLPLLEQLKPAFVFIENVPGLDTQTPGGTFRRFCRALEHAGYHTDFGVVDCQAFGVPQRRRRLLLLASRHGPVRLPSPTHGADEGLEPISTVADWIDNLPPIQAGEAHPNVPNHVASNLTELNLQRIRATPPGGGRADWPPELGLKCHEHHTGHSDVYGRMYADRPAPVLTTKCTSISNGRYGHPTADRPISVREAACLQTFPRDFVFHGGIKSATRQVGNAVPVLLAERVGRAFIEHLHSFEKVA